MSNLLTLDFFKFEIDSDTSFGAPTMRGEAFHLLEQFLPTRTDAGQLERFLRMLGISLDEAHQLIKNIPKMVDVDETDVDFLPSLAALVGAEFNFDILFDAQREEIKRSVHCAMWKGTATGVEAKCESITARVCEVLQFAGSPFLTNQLGQELTADDFVVVVAVPTVTLRIEQIKVTDGITFEIVDGGAPFAFDAVVTTTGTGFRAHTISVEVDLGTTAVATIVDAINTDVSASRVVRASVLSGAPGTEIDTAIASTVLSDAIDSLNPLNHLYIDLDDLEVVKQWFETWGFENTLIHPLIDRSGRGFNSFDIVVVRINLARIAPPSPPVLGFSDHQAHPELVQNKIARILPEQTPVDVTVIILVSPPRDLERM